MTFRNTIRLSMSNFSNVWKLLLYYIVCTLISCAILLPVAKPIIDKLAAADVFSGFSNLLNSIFSSPGTFAMQARNLITLTWTILSANAAGFILNYVVIIIMLIFVMPFLFGLSDLAIGEVLYGYMSSQTKYSFTGSFTKKLGKSCLLQLVKFLVMLPLNLIVVLSFYGTITLFAEGGIGLMLSGFLLVFVIILILCIKEAIFCCWMPCMVVTDVGPIKSLKQGIKATFRNFGTIFSTAVSIILIMIAINLFFGIFTFFIALIVTLPLTVLVLKVFNMVSYFTSLGMRFYVYPDQVITPKKMEEQDSTKRLKYLI